MAGEGSNSTGKESCLQECCGMCQSPSRWLTLFLVVQEFIQTKGYPSWTNVTCVREGAETPLFKQNFTNWMNKGEVTNPFKFEKKVSG